MENRKEKIKEMKQTLEENKDEIRETYLAFARDQYWVSKHSERIITMYLNLETGKTHIGIYASFNSYTWFDDDAITIIATIKGWDVSDKWSHENPDGETKDGYLYNPFLEQNDGWEPEDDVVELVIEKEFAKHFDDFIITHIHDEIERYAKMKERQVEIE